MNKEIIWVDLIRVIAIFMVVFLHSTAPILYKYNNISLNYWMVGNVYDSLVRVCVPLFFMVSGFLLLQKDEILPIYFSKRLKKILIPMIFWSLFFVFWKGWYENSDSLSISSVYSLILIPSYYHLWFLYALIGLYLYLPILRKVTHNSENTTLIYYIFIWFVAVSIIPLFESLINVNSRVDLQSFSGYIGYFVLGLLFGKKHLTSKHFIISIFIFILCIIVTSTGTYFLTANNDGEFIGYFYENLSPNIIIASCASFVAIKYVGVNSTLLQKTFFKKTLLTLSSCSFGIYFVHTIFIYLLEHGDLGFRLSPLSGNPLWSVPITAITVFILSFGVVFIIKKVPYLKMISP